METHEWEERGAPALYAIVMALAVVLDLAGAFLLHWPIWKLVALPVAFLVVIVAAILYARREK